MFVWSYTQTYYYMNEWANEQANEWINAFCEFLKVPLILNLAWVNSTLHPTPTLKPRPWPIRTLSVCQHAKFTSSLALSGVANTFWLVLFKGKRVSRGDEKMLPCLFSSANLFTETILCQWSANCLKSGLKRPCSSDVCAYMNISVCYYLQVIHILMCYIKPGIACQKKTPTRFCFMEKWQTNKS